MQDRVEAKSETNLVPVDSSGGIPLALHSKRPIERLWFGVLASLALIGATGTKVMELESVHDALSKKAGDKAQALMDAADNVAFPIINQILFSDLSKKFTLQQAKEIKASLDEFANRENIVEQQDPDFQPRSIDSDRSSYKYASVGFDEQTDRLQLQWALLKRAWFWKEYGTPMTRLLSPQTVANSNLSIEDWRSLRNPQSSYALAWDLVTTPSSDIASLKQLQQTISKIGASAPRIETLQID